MFPKREACGLNLGAVYWNTMRPADAEREWKLALAFAPDNAQLMNNLGLAAAGRKDYPEAIGYFERSMRLRPNYTDAHLNLGRLYEQTGQWAEAESQLQTAVAVAPLSIETRNELGKFYYQTGRFTDAAAQFAASFASIRERRCDGLSGRHCAQGSAKRYGGAGLSPCFNARAH